MNHDWQGKKPQHPGGFTETECGSDYEAEKQRRAGGVFRGAALYHCLFKTAVDASSDCSVGLLNDSLKQRAIGAQAPESLPYLLSVTIKR
ncbi:hypothetical protein AAFF_G00414860 [Aldrovandia affinis]|uniref:Uncharacterized protein n=1 Tax=Aldrovandia affinis TaxID=143900 RepID=A0AAD7SAM9_9TELE|nr:hypothetical protein AAFF_G00414860 [Aldrovandia affinis]